MLDRTDVVDGQVVENNFEISKGLMTSNKDK